MRSPQFSKFMLKDSKKLKQKIPTTTNKSANGFLLTLVKAFDDVCLIIFGIDAANSSCWVSSAFNCRIVSNSISLPFVSLRSYHSTVTERASKFIFDTIAECIRPAINEQKEEEERKKPEFIFKKATKTSTKNQMAVHNLSKRCKFISMNTFEWMTMSEQKQK